MTQISGTQRHALVGVVFLAACFAVLYGETLSDLYLQYTLDPNYSHGFLIPVVSAYILWQRRKELAVVGLRPSSSGLVVVLCGVGLFLAASLAGEYFTMRLSMLVVLAGAVVYALGWAFLKKIAFPFGFLIFMIPLPYLVYDAVAFPLKMLVSKYSVDFLTLVGVPILREGNILHLPQITLEVADACSGIRSIISLLALGAAMGYFFLEGFARRAALLLLAVPIAVFANGVRVVGTGILAVRYGGRAAEGFFHEFAGLVIFGVAFLLMVGAMSALARIGAGKKEASAA